MADLDLLNEQIIRYNLQFQVVDRSTLGWKVSKSQIAGKGLLATRKYKPGDTIFVDHPLVVGPRNIPDLKPFCVTCYGGHNLKSCSRECRLPVCSMECENNERHAAECAYLRGLNGDEGAAEDWDSNRFKALTVVRCLALDELARKIVFNLHKIRSRERNEVSALLEKKNAPIGEWFSPHVLNITRCRKIGCKKLRSVPQRHIIIIRRHQKHQWLGE